MFCIEQMLKDWCTRLKFDGYMSNWVEVNNGIVQGDPLSIILYLFYNTDLIANVKKGKAKIAYIDDANFYAEGRTFQEAYSKLSNMMDRDGRGLDWSLCHNSHFETLKLTLVGFSRCHTPDPLWPGRQS